MVLPCFHCSKHLWNTSLGNNFGICSTFFSISPVVAFFVCLFPFTHLLCAYLSQEPRWCWVKDKINQTFILSSKKFLFGKGDKIWTNSAIQA